ncbi:MAG: Xylose isomerase-like barrel, partial [Bacilli bacterium]|nr:Xylose isomerase-like barrel [Bacilli bacterium]
MKLGFSLNPQLIAGNPENDSSAAFYASFGDSKTLLKELKDEGISSIELRNLPRTTDVEVSKRVIHTVWDAGLDVTIHGHVGGQFQGPLFADLYPSIKELILHSGIFQQDIMMPIHAYAASEGSKQELSDKTVELFQHWAAMVKREQIPLRFAIELNRKKPAAVDPGDTCAGVLQMIDQINSPFVG